MYALFWQHRNGVEIVAIVRRAVVYAALGILPTFCVGTFYFLSGSWESWWFANFESFFLRNAGGRFNPFVLAYAIPLIAVTVSGWYAAVRIVRPDSQDTYRLVIVWTSGCFLSVLLPGTTYLYYLAAACPATVLSAVPLFDERGPAGKWSLIFSIIIAVIFLNPYERWIQSRANTVNAERLAEAVSDHVGPGRGCLLVFDGPTSLYRMTDSCTLSRFVYPDHLNNALEKDALGVDQLSLVEDLLASQPPVIVTADLALTRQNPFAKDAVNGEVSAHYQYLHSEEIGGRRITAWTLGEPAMSD
jgi:hypothetical protein